MIRGIKLFDENGKEKKHLLLEENTVLVHVKEEVDRVIALKSTPNTPKGCTPNCDLRHAFGICKSKLNTCVIKYYQNNASSKRKKNSNQGLTIFNSDKKRKEVFTPLEFYKRLQRKRHRESITEAQLTRTYNQLDADTLHQCRLGANELMHLCVGIDTEIERVMQMTNGVISWRCIANEIAGGPDNVQAASKDALRRHIMGTNDFRYTVTQTLPQCNGERSRRIRMRWATEFHIFWEGAKLVAQKVQVLLFHIDEKWFFS